MEAKRWTKDITPTEKMPPTWGFGHLSLTVPDVGKAFKLLEAAVVEVYKPLEEANRASVPLSNWEDERGIGTGEPHENYKSIVQKIASLRGLVSQTRESRTGRNLY